MNAKEYAIAITEELKSILLDINEAQLETLITSIRSADRIFVAGAGRSRLMICGFAMRLMQAGFTSYVVGETVTPGINGNDLLIIASGSGSTGTLTTIAQKCKKIGAQLALITASAHSPIGSLADYVLEIPTSTSKMDAATPRTTIQPGGSAFEQSALLVGDALAAMLLPGGDTDHQNKLLMGNHANLE